MQELKIEEGNSTGDYIEATVMPMGLVLEVVNPWSGDTHSGFGRDASVTLTKDKARALGDYLIAWADGAMDEPKPVLSYNFKAPWLQRKDTR